MKGILSVTIDIFICGLLNYWGFLNLQESAELSSASGFAEFFWVLYSFFLLGYLLVSYSIPTLVLSIFHFGFLIGSVCYCNHLKLLVCILVQMVLFGLFVLFVEKKERVHKLKPIVFVLLLTWLIITRSLI
jgi:hypothetical protein